MATKKAPKAKAKKATPTAWDAFTKEHSITHACAAVDENPHYPWEGASHWLVTLTIGKGKDKRTLERYYSVRADDRAPKLSHVLGCMAIDADTVEKANTFAAWCDEFGYSPHAERSKTLYFAVKEDAEKLRKFIGDEAVYAALLALARGEEE